MGDVLYSGGPCSGRHVTVDDARLADGRLTCGGTSYKVYEVYPGEWLALLPSARPPDPQVLTSKRAPQAWHRLVHAIVSTVPADVRRSQQARLRMLRIGRR